jgi:pyruvate-formate lyase-activating enzyme
MSEPTIIIKDILDECYQDYKKPSMMIATSRCDWKCCRDQGIDTAICHNNSLAKQPNVEYPISEIYQRYINNPLTSAIVIGGLEPFLQSNEIISLIKHFRQNGCKDDIIIYTGYYPDEVLKQIIQLKEYQNIIIKFGRFMLNKQKVYDVVLGIELNSDNQFAIKIS